MSRRELSPSGAPFPAAITQPTLPPRKPVPRAAPVLMVGGAEGEVTGPQVGVMLDPQVGAGGHALMVMNLRRKPLARSSSRHGFDSSF